MAKRKRKKPKAPPLSLGDKALYHAMVWGCFVGPWVITIAGTAIAREIMFASGRVIAFGMSGLWLLYCCAGMVLSLLFYWMKQKRYPVFGNREVKYGPPQYNEVYPLLGHYETNRCPNARWKKTARMLRCLWTLSFAALLSGLLAISPAYVLTEENSVEVYGRLGCPKETYGAERIAAVELEGVFYGGRYGSTKTVTLRLEMLDGEEFVFDYEAFDNTGNVSSGTNMAIFAMQHIKEYVAPTAVTIRGADNLPKIVDRLHLSAAEEAQLYTLFDTELS
ncbi:MAG: hypothetical protein IKV99_00085 [Oscillospiraceae bacterium]|nr:hypothetical protein [Oscillospiraceae bacterium]